MKTSADSASATGTFRRRPGGWRETSILLPLAALAMALLSVVTLFAFRKALTVIESERVAEALRMARVVAEQIAAADTVNASTLRRLAPLASSVAVLDDHGNAEAHWGDIADSNLFDALGGDPPVGEATVGWRELNDSAAPTVVAYVPASVSGGRRWLRLDLPANALYAQRRGLAILNVVVLGANGALGILLVIFLRRLLAPVHALLERAERAQLPADAQTADHQDEIGALVDTFERALGALSRPEGPASDDISIVERALSPSLESGLLLLDLGGRVVGLNHVARHLLDLPEGAAGAPFEVVFAAHPSLLAALRDAIAHGHPIRRERLQLVVRGEPRPLGFTVHALRRQDASPNGFLVLFADLTDANRLEDESRRAEAIASLGALSAGVAHELRNGLSTMLGYLTLLDRLDLPATADEYLNELRLESTNLQRVTDDFLAFARPGSARLQEFDLAVLVRRAASDPALGAPVAIDAGNDATIAIGDPQLLERALRNVVRNAVEAQREAGAAEPVEVRLRRGGGLLRVEILDRGKGIPAAIRDRLFTPFASGRAGGVGLGLALSQRILMLHGGHIEVADRDPGPGTSVAVVLPSP